MAKCQDCGRIIENEEIIYRPSNKGGRRSGSIKLCSGCVDRHDSVEGTKKATKMLFGVAVAIAVIGALVYLVVQKYR